jgi:cytochrome P450
VPTAKLLLCCFVQGLRKNLVTLTLHSILQDCKQGKVATLNQHFCQLTKKNTTQMLINEDYFGPDSTASTMIKAEDYQESVLDLGRLMGVFNYGDYVPPLKGFDLQGYRKEMQKVRATSDAFFGKIIDEHRQILSSKSSEELSKRDRMDLIDLLLTRAGEDDGKQLTENQIRGFLMVQ